MKVGLVLDTTLDSEAGVQQYFKGLARFLISRGHEVKFLVPPSKNEGEFKGRVISFGKEIVLRGNANTVPTVLFTKKTKIRKVLNTGIFDIIHIGAPFSPFFGAKILREVDCPIVCTYLVYGKNCLYRLGVALLRIYLSSIYKKIDSLIVVSETARREAEIAIPRKYQKIPIGVDLSKFSQKVESLDQYLDGKINIVSIGRFEKRKGQSYLIKAFAKIRNDKENIRLILVGDGPERKNLEKLVKKLKLKNNVIFEGYVSEKLKPGYYASADLCVFPAIYGESFGVVLIESMASGKPTIAFANEGYKCILKSLPELLVENKKVDKLALKINTFLENEELRKEYGRKCLKEAQKFKWDEIGKQVLDIYNKLVRAR